MRRIFYSVIVLIFSSFLALTAHADDGIPDNCEYNGQYQRANLFPRYEVHNSRFVLVDWNTGADAMILESSLSTDAFWILGWSADCHYLAAKVGAGHDFYIWDTVSGGRVGVVAEGRRIHWSPNITQAVVERRAGAVLWTLSNNSQLPLTDIYEPTQGRNFSRINWDYDHNWLITTRIDGVRAAYDLNSGQLVEDFLTILGTTENGDLSASDGLQYNCSDSSAWPPTAEPRVYPVYEEAAKRLVLTSGGVVVKILEDHIDASTVSIPYRPWSANCRYLMARFGTSTASQTVVWDVVTGQRVDTIDAVGRYHQFTFDETGDYAVIETREGGFLWHLPSNTRILLTDANNGKGRNFHSLEWFTERGWLITVPVGAANGVMIYDMAGNQVGFYPTQSPITPVSYVFYPEQNRLVVYTPQGFGRDRDGRETGLTVYDLTIGEGTSIYTGRYIFAPPVLSPGGRYLVIPESVNGSTVLRVWDLHALPENYQNRRNLYRHRTDFYYVSTIRFHDETTVKIQSSYYDILTGERIEAKINVPTVFNTTPALSGFGTSIEATRSGFWIRRGLCPYYRSSYYNPQLSIVFEENQLIVRNFDTKTTSQILLPEVEDSFWRWSWDCHYFVSRDNNGQFITWDTTTLQPISAIVLDTTEIVALSPDQSMGIGRTRWWDYYLFDFTTGQKTPIIFDVRASIEYEGIYWDFDQNRVFIPGSGLPSEMIVVDLSTGVEQSRLGTGIRRPWRWADARRANYWLDEVNNRLFIHYLGTLAVWDLNTMQGTEVITDPRRYTVRTAGVSPDGRYLVTVSYGIHVWDLTNLPRNIDDRTPTFDYIGPGGLIRSMRFIDNTTIEITKSSGDPTRWDITTGKQVQ